MTRTRSPTCEPTSFVGMRCIDFLLLSNVSGPAHSVGEARRGKPNRHLDAFPQIVVVSIVVVIHRFSYLLCAPAHNKKPSSFLEDEGPYAFVVPPPFFHSLTRSGMKLDYALTGASRKQLVRP